MRMEFDEEKLATFRRKDNKKADVSNFAYAKVRNLKFQGRETREQIEK
jgi:hypothetical protein